MQCIVYINIGASRNILGIQSVSYIMIRDVFNYYRKLVFLTEWIFIYFFRNIFCLFKFQIFKIFQSNYYKINLKKCKLLFFQWELIIIDFC